MTNYYLKLESGIYNPDDPGTAYNKVLDSLETPDTVYSPWTKVSEEIYNMYNEMNNKPDAVHKLLPGAFIDYSTSGPMVGLHISVMPPEGVPHPPLPEGAIDPRLK